MFWRDPRGQEEPWAQNRPFSLAEDEHRYNLRPRKEASGDVEGSIAGGHGMLVGGKSKGVSRGRKSLFSMAQQKAHCEIKSGKQTTLVGALKALNAPVEGSSGGLITGWRLKVLTCSNNWSFASGGDLNFSLERSEIWVSVAQVDPLSNFFIKSLEEVGLYDIEPVKLRPTWSNKRVGEERMTKRIDRFLMSESILDEQFCIKQKPPSPFKFNSNWLEQADFVNLIFEQWVPFDETLRESAALQFEANRKKVKQASIKWAHRKKIKDEKDLATVEVDLEALYLQELAEHPNDFFKGKVKEFEHRKSKLLANKEAAWRLKSRALWLSQGDGITKFFHKLANHKRNVNTIWQLTRSDGFVASSFEDLAMAGVEHFRGIYKEERRSKIAKVLKLTSFFPSFVSEEDNRRMMEEFSKDELKEVLDSFQKDKSPGPDGWPVEFFLGFLEVIEKELLRVIEESRVSGKMLAAFNSTFIAPIPKSDNPSSFEEYRPISLCNCIYKIIAKVIAREGLHSIKTKRVQAMVVKLDLSKAYDRTSWLYLRLMLIHLVFHVHFVNWVMDCLTSVSFSVLINGSASPFFRPGRGLRQGCPISPLLFLIGVEGFNRAPLEAKRSGAIKGIKVGSSLCLTHLLFVDDILLFCDGSRRDALKLREVLDLYCSATGMLVNIGKSTVSFMGISEDDIRSYTQLFPFKLTELDRGGIGSKLGTIGGFRGEVDWDKEKRGIALVKWKRIALPKIWGRWGLKDIHSFSRALVAKCVWRLISVNGLWSKVMIQKYIEQDSMEDWIRRPTKTHNNASIIWKVVVLAFPLVGTWLVWTVGRGNRVRLEEDPWAGCGGFHRLSEGLLQGLQERGLFNLCQVVDPGLSSVWRQEWMSSGTLGLVDDAAEEWEAFTFCLRSNHVRIKDSDDELIWSKNPAFILQKQKRGKHGPGRCPLCNENEETIHHLLLTCAYSVSMWKEVGIFTGFKDVWGGFTLEESLRNWYGNRMVKSALALPLIIWVEKAPRHLTFQVVDKTGAGAYFDGASQGNSQVSGAGGVIFLKDTHIIRIKAGLGRGSNNFA
eukprot:Gb_24170 [translate_table: standard]